MRLARARDWLRGGMGGGEDGGRFEFQSNRRSFVVSFS